MSERKRPAPECFTCSDESCTSCREYHMHEDIKDLRAALSSACDMIEEAVDCIGPHSHVCNEAFIEKAKFCGRCRLLAEAKKAMGET